MESWDAVAKLGLPALSLTCLDLLRRVSSHLIFILIEDQIAGVHSASILFQVAGSVKYFPALAFLNLILHFSFFGIVADGGRERSIK